MGKSFFLMYKCSSFFPFALLLFVVAVRLLGAPHVFAMHPAIK
jgi:hypothetical protein